MMSNPRARQSASPILILFEQNFFPFKEIFSSKCEATRMTFGTSSRALLVLGGTCQHTSQAFLSKAVFITVPVYLL